MLSWQELNGLKNKLKQEELCTLEVQLNDGDDPDILILRQCDVEKAKKIILKAFDDWENDDIDDKEIGCENPWEYYQKCLDDEGIIYQINMEYLYCKEI